MKVKDLKLDKRNYNKHNEENKRLIKKSIDECGFGRSVVIDDDNEVICGNGVVSTLDENTNIKVVETDGNELVVIRRKDLKREDEKRDKLAILDNSTGKLSEWDYDLLKEDFAEDYLNSLGIELPELGGVNDDTELSETESKYTRKVNVPIYEIKGEKPEISDMINTERADELIELIKSKNLPSDIEDFFIKTATRLYEYKYDNIAEFYAHQDKDVQEIMEKLALVIIDFDKAIENGYVQLNKFIEQVFLSENNIDE